MCFRVFRNWPILLQAALFLLSGLFSGCDYARMKNDEAVDLYEMEFPVMPREAVPSGEGWAMPGPDPARVRNPLTPSQRVVAAGKEAYGHFCLPCHGPRGDGRGTVGQSFAPLPTELKSEYVQTQSDGELFVRIGRGYRRHPPLSYTVSPEGVWAIILYMRSSDLG